ncbi:MAG TPA: peptide deformylase [Bacteriovoracaceae bacterium]|nr:peptide deformylase [Bacteriovoracaceae bacterium]
MIRPICKMGNPVLRKRAKAITKSEIFTDSFSQLLTDLKDSMVHYGGIGIAAPQIGVDLQVALIELVGLNRYGEEINLPLTTFINPRIKYLREDLQGFWEGCLSVPGLRGYVERPDKIEVSYQDEKGDECKLVAEGFLATVVQHELDHLEGILYVDRIKDSKLLSYQEEFEHFIQEKTIE